MNCCNYAMKYKIECFGKLLTMSSIIDHAYYPQISSYRSPFVTQMLCA